MDKDADQAYRKFIRKLVAYYSSSARIPQRESIDLWVEEFSNAKIHPDYLDRIFDVVKESKTFPSNLPADVKAAFWQIRKSDGASFVQHDERTCDVKGCHGGLLFMRKECELDYAARYVFRCKACNRAHEIGIPAAYLDDLERDGYRQEVSIYAAK